MGSPCHPCDMPTTDYDTEALRERFARAVKSERERRGLSQSELAELIDVSIDHISKIERQVYQPSLDMAARFIVVLGLDANVIIEAKPTKRKVPRSRLDMEAQLNRYVERLDERTLAMLIDFTELMEKRLKRAKS